MALSASDTHHVNNVLRLPAGAQLVVVSKANLQAFAATLTTEQQAGSPENDSLARALIGAPLHENKESQAKSSHLLVALPKSDLPEWITEKATELGISSVCFFQGDRSVVKLKTPADILKKQRRLESVAEAASKQSKRISIPRVSVVESLETALHGLPTNTTFLSCSLDADAVALRECPAPQSNDYALIIGPEGDFSPSEISLLTNSGALKVSLSALTLRVETAAICAIAQSALLWQAINHPRVTP